MKLNIKFKIISICILLLFVLTSISFCNGDESENKNNKNTNSEESKSNTPDKIIIRLPWIHHAQYAGVYVAKSKGFFEKYGVENVEIVPGGPGIRAIDMISSGSEHFGMSGATSFFSASFHHRELVMVSALDQKHAFCYFARKDQGINSPEDFKGRRVGHKVTHEKNLVAILGSVGLTLEDVELVPVPPGMSMFFVEDPEKMVPIWPGHGADEPLRAEERGIEVTCFYPEEFDGKDRIGNLLFTSKAFEKKHPEIVQGVVSAILEGWTYAFENPEYATDETMKYIDNPESSRDHQKNMLLKMKDFMLTEETGMKIGNIHPGKWKKVLNTYEFKTGNLGLSLDEIINSTYVEKYYEDKNK